MRYAEKATLSNDVKYYLNNLLDIIYIIINLVIGYHLS